MEINSYATVYQLGHREVEEIFQDSVQVEEKVDGSQFSFGLMPESAMVLAHIGMEFPEIKYELKCRSKGKQMILDAPEKMFGRAVDSIKEKEKYLQPGWIYRCEFLAKPHHNVLCYDRVPLGNLIGFDVMTGVELYLTYEAKKAEFARIGLETVPLLYQGEVKSVDQFKSLLELTSVLGGTTVEGVVVKNYDRFTREKKIMIGKYVSEKFKEIAGGEWRKANPTQGDITEELIKRYRTPARWQKAVQHLKDQGILTQSPKDIGNLMKETQADVEKECADEIRGILYAHFMPKIKRGVIAGEAEWYKEELLKFAFEVKDAQETTED